MKIWPIVSLVLAGVVIFLILTRPSGDSEAQNKREDAYRNQIAILQLEKDSLKALQTTIVKEVYQERKSDSIQLEAKEREIRVLKTRIVKSRQEVQPMIDTIKPLRVFVNQQDSLIKLQDSTIAIYQQSLYDLGRQFTALEGTIYDSRLIEERIQQECETRKAELLSQVERMEKKNRKKIKIWQAAAIVGTIGGLFIGSR